VDDTILGIRNKRGDWKPNAPIQFAPVLIWPPKPVALVNWLFGAQGFFLPWNITFTVIAFVTWRYLTPSSETTRALAVGWIAYLLVRNALIVLAFYGAWHLRLYIQRAQGNSFKYDAKQPSKGNSAFLFRNQNIDNLIWTFASAIPFWTFFETIMLWASSNGFTSYVSWTDHPIYCTLLFMALPFWSDLHFYVIHRIIHWPPLYRSVHSLHHNNVNPGPFSGLAMHPVEHLLYFSGVLIFLVVPSNTLHVVGQLVLKALGPAQTHSGYDKVVIGQETTIDTNSYAHYLHHKYFECNYADALIPLDKWFGTFHDGTPEKQDAMEKRLSARKAKEMRLAGG
jgi:sterol desaturase/sphingolipid hydroxylase (fatty acid hydroxylase superfamily)